MNEILFIGMVLLSIYVAALLLYVAMFFALVKFTGKFLYLPKHAGLEKLKMRAHEQGLTLWENEKGEAIGWRKKSAVEKKRFLIFPGRYGMALDKQYIISLIHAIYGDKVGIYILEYPAYGARGGVASQYTLTEAALEGVKLLRKMGDEPLYIVGESLGAAVGVQVAVCLPEEIEGMFLIAPFSNLPDVAAYRYPLFPIGRFLRDDYDSCEALKKYHNPVAILVAENDHTSPARLGKKLYESYNGPKRLWIVHGAGHNNIDYSPSATWWRQGFEFLCK
jgi:uncharacterized protein